MIDQGSDMDVLPRVGLVLRPGDKIYLGFPPNAEEEQFLAVFNKLKATDLAEKARHRSGTSAHAKFQLEAREMTAGQAYSFVALKPKFDMFEFPPHCAGAALGFDSTKSKNELQLNRQFHIPVAALVREGEVKWYPGPEDLVLPGDKGLVMSDMFADRQRQLEVVDLNKLEVLWDVNQFRE